jgi:regulator of PEP synthase PpsR (kinase-PPPase family)
MECALEAFAQAHANSIDNFRKYESEWNDKLIRLTAGSLIYTEFKTLLTNKLKFLYTDKRGTKHQANHAEVMLNRIAALEHNMADMSMMQDDRMEDLEAAYHSRSQAPASFCVPRDDGTMVTENSTIGSATNYRALLAEQQ